jgi:acyl transferase domain-containing protein
LLAVLRGDAGAPALDLVDVVQPALFSVMVSMAALWRSWGVEPTAVVGHSQGEIAAAYVCGALSLRDATKIVALRSRALVALIGHGAMGSVAASADVVAQRLAPWDGRVSIAVVNGPRAVVVSGEPDALDEFIGAMKADGFPARRISVDYASHSHQVARVRDEVVGALADVAPATSRITFYSTLHGKRIDTAELNGDYWYDNLREKVQFESAVRRSVEDGFRVFVEMSPHPVLTVPVQEIVEDVDDAVVLSSTRRDRGEVEALLGSLAQLYVRGGPVDWTALFESPGRVDLPTYAFQRQRYWVNSTSQAAVADLPAAEPPVDDEPQLPLSDRIRPLPENDATALVLAHVLDKVAVVLGQPSGAAINPDQKFKEIGFDSLLSMELSKRLTTSTGLKLRANLVLRHPSPRMVAGHIVSTMTAPDSQ